MRYIDFDGVILDTEALVFEEWKKNPLRFRLTQEEKIEYIKNQDWERIINEAPVINDSIYLLKQMNPTKSAILARVYSLENEAMLKIMYLRDKGIRQDIILVPYYYVKTDIVNPLGSILVDASICDLKNWQSKGGLPLFFDKNNTNIDSRGVENTFEFQRVRKINASYEKSDDWDQD